MKSNYLLKKTVYLLFLIYVWCSTLFSQQLSNQVSFEHISIDQGLSHSTVFSVIQDHKGFMWFGTLDGLNKYDGYNFKLYKSNPYDKSTLSNNIVFKVFEDKENNLWVGTLGGGLNKFDRAKDKFTKYRFNANDTTSISDDNVRAIFQDSKGRLWVGTNNGLNLFNPKTNSFKRFLNDEKNSNSISNNYIWSIYESKSLPNVIWIGTYGGLNKYDVEKNKFTRYVKSPGASSSLSNNYIWAINGFDNYLYIGTDNGLNIFNIRTEKFENILYSTSDKNSIGGNKIWCLYFDENNHLLVGTLGGGVSKSINSINKIEPLKFERFQKNPIVKNSLSHNDIWSIYIDKTGLLWIATDLGVNKYDPGKEKFKLIQNHPFDKNSITYNEVTAIYKEINGSLWVGTRRGLNKIDLKSSQVNRFEENNFKGISNNYIRAIHKTKKGDLLVGTNGGGLLKYDNTSNLFRRFKYLNRDVNLSSANITSIYEDKEATLWIGTLGGINRIDSKTGNVKVYSAGSVSKLKLSHDYAYKIYQTKDNLIWIGTLGGGLNMYDSKNEKFIHYKENPNDSTALSNNTIWAIHEDRIGNLWIGTNNGLNKFNRTTGKFEYYNERRGLSQNAIYGILEDELGNLWLSSNEGLIKYNIQNREAKYFSTGDGLQSRQFTGNAYFKDETGNMYFGGINGLNYFHPQTIKENKHIPPVVITDFQIFNKSVNVGDNSPLKKDISETNNIELSFSQNVFSFEYAALHYSTPTSNQYAYKMDGFDKNWINAGTRRFVTYTNLDAGEYVFNVIGSNSDGVWNKVGASIAIIINPPFYKTWWFISISLLTIFVVAGAILYLRFKSLLEIERLRVKISADLHDDIGTRLTEISLLTDILYHTDENSVSSSDRETIKKIGGIARSLIENMSEIVWLINPKRDSLYELFLKLKDCYEEILSHVQIILHINNLEFLEKIKLPMDYRKNVYLIFKEAINNSIKYSSCTEISLNADVHNNQLKITMYDNGIGFDVNKNYVGNGLQNMKKRAEATGGKLRIQSKPGNGTMIEFIGKI